MSDEGVVHPSVAGYLGSSEIIYGELKLVLFLIVRGFNHIVIFEIYPLKSVWREVFYCLFIG